MPIATKLKRRVPQTVRDRFRRAPSPRVAPSDMEAEFVGLYSKAAPFTMTSAERMYALWQAVRYVSCRGITGDVVECGVWRGGSSLLAALTLEQLGDTSRSLHLYDTFEGMSAPSDRDVAHNGVAAADSLAQAERTPGAFNDWCFATLEDVRRTMAISAYPRVRYVQGMVEDTLPAQAPERIALLRLDTDWYESTLHELRHLYPRLAPGGVLIIDDYGHWQGARAAVDEYFAAAEAILLQRIDYTGRLVIKHASTAVTGRG